MACFMKQDKESAKQGAGCRKMLLWNLDEDLSVTPLLVKRSHCSLPLCAKAE